MKTDVLKQVQYLDITGVQEERERGSLNWHFFFLRLTVHDTKLIEHSN